MNTPLFTLLLSLSLAFHAIAQAHRRAPGEGPKEEATMADRDSMIWRINWFITVYQQHHGYAEMTQAQLQAARAWAFREWSNMHYGDLDAAGPGFKDIKNKELSSNIGIVDLDWMSILGKHVELSAGPLGDETYLAGKVWWFMNRDAAPDPSSFRAAFPDTNWRALAAVKLLASGKVSIEEVFMPGRATQPVHDAVQSLKANRNVDKASPGLAGSPTQRPETKPGGVTLAMGVGPHSFINRTNAAVDTLLCVSLKGLVRVAKQPAPDTGDLLWLGGMSRIVAVVPDPQHGDLVLVGRAEHDRPRLHTDDVFVLLNNTLAKRGHPFVSLDPKPENVLALNRLLANTDMQQVVQDHAAYLQRVRDTVGPQEVIIGNIPRESRAAHSMVMADYAMKRLCQGLIEAPGALSSSLDRSIATFRKAVAANERVRERESMARYWFCVGPHQPTFATNSSGAIWLERCDVIVRTERQLATPTGKLVDARRAPDTNGEAFAAEFSRNYALIAKVHPSLLELENLFHLHALLSAANFIGRLASFTSTTTLKTQTLLAPTALRGALPGLANGKLVHLVNDLGNGRTQEIFMAPIIAGGVDLGVKVTPQSVAQATPRQSGVLAAALQARPTPVAVLWSVRR